VAAGRAWEAVVIGSGPLGAAVARRLAESGRAVAIVERGPPVSDPPGSHLRNAEALQRDPDGYFAAIDRYLRYVDPDARDSGLPGACVSAAVGGQGVLWTNNCPRAVAGVDRPEVMSAEEWDRYYAAADAYLGVGTEGFARSVRHRRIAGRLAPALERLGRRVVDQPFAGRLIDATRLHYAAPADVLDGVGGVDVLSGEARLVRGGARGGRCAVLLDGRALDAEVVVVAAGAIDTPRILWEASVGPPALGTHVSYHSVLVAQVVLAEELCSDAPEPDPPPRLQIPPTAGHPWNAMVLRDTNPLAPAPPDLSVPANRLVELQLFCPVDPAPGSRMSLGPGDIRFDVPLGPADEERRAGAMDDALRLCGLLGRFRSGCEPQWVPAGLAHVMGTCRIGSPQDGVADADGRVRGLENLYLATVGLIPNAMAVNPTLTGVALAIRTADRIARR
jgi:choline dehydrogenase-like flavoprotein